MTIEAQLPDGTILEFPDGTPDQVIQSSVKKILGIQSVDAKPQGAINDDTRVSNNIPADMPVNTSQQGLASERFGSGAVRPDAAGLSVVEPAATLVTGAIAEPVAGLAGLAVAPFSGSERAAETVSATREALTFKPRSEEGTRGLQAVGNALAPVAETLKDAEKFLGDSAFESTGSPAVAAAASTIPTVILELLGIASAKGTIKASNEIAKAANKAEIKKAVVESAPDIDQLKSVSRDIYKELDESGVTLRPKAFKGLENRVRVAAEKAGFDKDLTPKSAAVLNRFKEEVGSSPSLSDIDSLRKVAGNAAKSLEPADAAIGSVIVENIDQFLDVVTPSGFNKARIPSSEINPKFKMARELWGRSRRSELINDAFERAKNQASGFENGLVTNFRSILNNKKKSRFFKPNELEVMRQVVRGTTKENIAKLIGRLGFSEGHATNLIGGSLGVAAGAQLAGPVGAVAVPVIGQVSRKLAQRLTRGNAEFADTVVRAGANAEDIAKAYIKNTPPKLRSSAELSELLVRPDVALDRFPGSNSRLITDAVDIAKGNRILAAVAAAPGAIQAGANNEGQQ